MGGPPVAFATKNDIAMSSQFLHIGNRTKISSLLALDDLQNELLVEIFNQPFLCHEVPYPSWHVICIEIKVFLVEKCTLR